MPIQEKLRVCRKDISEWRRNNPTNAPRRIKELKASIDHAHMDPLITLDEIHTMRKELSWKYRNEENFLKQKSRNNWLNNGDCNTRSFMQ